MQLLRHHPVNDQGLASRLRNCPHYIGVGRVAQKSGPVVSRSRSWKCFLRIFVYKLNV